MSESTIFALDIGTRKIAGLFMEKHPSGYKILAACIKEQRPNAMKDGQIHDIPLVAQVIKEVKKELEHSLRSSLTEAAVAAAGRSLKTRRGRAEIRLLPNQRLSSEKVKTLELAAVQMAQSGLRMNSSLYTSDAFLCVGYSVVRYYLDNDPIGALVGHQGATATVEVIATFLPRVVVDSLGSALEMADLKMRSLTLEPIAAIHVVVPSSMRMLNVALVDIGAGTSDIAISSEGTIAHYGMVPTAGDTITHTIADYFLLDFLEAEQVKRRVQHEEILTAEDVLTNPLEIPKDELLALIGPSISELAAKICQEIVDLNGGRPKGVILVGGGSLAPAIEEEIASILRLPQHLVKVRERESLRNITGADEFCGPHVITPLGIGAAHLDGLSMELQSVTINGTSLQFLFLAEANVGEALIQAGYTMRNLWGKLGEAITIEINGKVHTVPGTLGTHATILHNGKEATVETPLSGLDVIEIVEPEDGECAQATLGDIIDCTKALEVTINGDSYTFGGKVLVNEKPVPPSYQLQDKDRIVFQEATTIGQALTQVGYTAYKSISFLLNGEPRSLRCKYLLTVNGVERSLDSYLETGMSIRFEPELIYLEDIIQSLDTEGIQVKVNQQLLTLPGKPGTLTVDGLPPAEDYTLRPGANIQFSASSGYILSDIFLVFNPQKLANKGPITMRVNGETAGYTYPLADGDHIEISS